ncbi:MAG: 30S ribosome-binding factor RbfA [Caldilineaceae bacterium]|nr:30S ribosome-binding factor RbfA [Caldilineaceae bacterium]MCB9139828.1 30S ribosome-binding factor RbfA [Caldilineaceae bacterium]
METSANIRQERLAQMLFEEFSIIIGSELQDPRLVLAQVTDVRVSRDLRNVKVFVYHDDEEVSRRDVMQALEQARAYIRREIAQRLSLRAVPELLFIYDESPQRAARIQEILDQIAEERSEREVETGNGAEEDDPTHD